MSDTVINKTRATMAKENFLMGYNCAQAVLLAFSDLINIDPEMLAKISSSFGGGMGRLREVCGAVSGSFMALGCIEGYSDPKESEGKKLLYSKLQAVAKTFKEENGSIICRELLEGVGHTDGSVPEARSTEYYKKRPCAELVYCAAEILENHLKEEGIIK